MTLPRSALSVAADLTTFLVGATGVFIVHVVGDLPVADLLLIPLAPLLVALRPQRLRRKRLALLFVLLGLWLFGEVVSDVYRGAAIHDWMRTDARILFWMIDLATLALLVAGNTRRHVLFLAGFATGSLLQDRLQPNDFTGLWKFGYATAVTFIVLLVVSYLFHRRKHGVVLFLLLCLATLDLAFNFRSAVMFLFVTAVFVLPVVPERIGTWRVLPVADSGLRIVLLGVLVIAAAGAARAVVMRLASQGMLGQEAMEKNELQARSQLGLFLGARPEILVSSRAVLDSPIVGHGSWAKDTGYAEMYRDLCQRYGLMPDRRDNPDEEELIPTHSHLMDAWVGGGILGALFWIAVFCVVMKGVIRASTLRPLLAPAYVYGFVSFLWAILFSPPGGVTILPEAFWLIVACDLLEAAGKMRLVTARNRFPDAWRPRTI